MSEVYIENGILCIRHTDNASPYPIEIDRCDSYPKILKFIHQLTGKTWCTRDIICNFIEVACEHHGLDSHRDGAS